jgi:hypothetical protein
MVCPFIYQKKRRRRKEETHSSKLHSHPPLQATLTPPLHHSNTPSTNFHTPLLVLNSSLATVPSGNLISLLFRLLSAGRSKKARATSACSCFEKGVEVLLGGGIWTLESAERQVGQCFEGRVRVRVKGRVQIVQVGLECVSSS